MMGLLDFLGSSYGLFGGVQPDQTPQALGLPQGFFGAANPTYGIDPKKTTDEFVKALREGGETGLMGQGRRGDEPWGPRGVVTDWNAPGTTYSPSLLAPQQAPNPFDARTVNAPIFSNPQQIAAANVRAPAPGQTPAVDTTGFFAPPSGAQAPLQPPMDTDISSRSRTAPQAPIAPPQAPSPQMGGNGMAALMNFLTAPGGLGGSIAGAIGGATTGQRLDPIGQQQQIYNALVENGASKNEAMAAAVSPELFRAIAPQYFSKGQPIETGVDPLTGQKSFSVYDAKTHTFTPITTSGQSIGNAATPQIGAIQSALQQAKAGGASPEQLYQMIPESYREGVRALIEGRALPANLGRAGVRAQLVLLAHEIDPSMNENEIAARQAGWRDWYGGGKSSETARKLDQSALHFGELVSDKMANLPGHQIPAANAVANTFNTQVMGKGAENAFLTNAHALADELGGLFKGSNLSDSEIKAWEAGLSPNMSLEQQRTAARTLLGLYRDGLSALEKKRVDALGPVAAQQKGPLIGPDAEAALKRVENFAYGRTDHSGGSVPNLKVGQTHTVGGVTIKKVSN